MTGSVRVPRNLVEVAALITAGDATALADELLALSKRIGRSSWGHDGKTVARLVTAASAEVRAALMTALIARADEPTGTGPDDGAGLRVDDVLALLLRHQHGDLPVDVASAVLVRALLVDGGSLSGHAVPIARSLLDRGETLPGAIVGALRRRALAYPSPKTELHRLVARLPAPVLNPGEEWADRILADLRVLPEGWPALLAHALTATAARPSATWERRAGVLLAALGTPPAAVAPSPVVVPSAGEVAAFAGGGPVAVPSAGGAAAGLPGASLPVVRRVILGWLGVAAARGAEVAFDPFNAVALRGLCWMVASWPGDPDSARVLGRLTESALRKLPDVGPRSVKVANAAVHALSRSGGAAELAQLARLATRVTYRPTLKEIHAALDGRAAAAGLTREEIEEIATPGYGLTDVGRRVVPLGDAEADVTVAGGRITVAWRGPTGKPVKTVPAVVRRDFAVQLEELRAEVKDAEKMLAAVSERLDRLFLARRTWAYARWRERYLDHPLVGTLARRLLWKVGDVTCGFDGKTLRTLDDTPVDAAPDARVEIWHPVGSADGEALAWRDWLERHRVTQPFKQAHRETYPLTVAEEQTGTYSNRFAAHVLRQHQFSALAAVRGWRSPLRLAVEDSDDLPAVRELPQWGLRAELWVDGVGDDWDHDTTAAGVYLRVVTDQVRFYRTLAPQNDGDDGPVPLLDVPPLVFSEVMRDVDLFAGVASVGNDPAWQDGGPGGRFRHSWQSYSFGELSATAETRRELLTRLLPRLTIGARCAVDGRFLVVRGELRTYKIHLGSGNMLMSPDDRYLCIVPDRYAQSGAGGVFLPFEGDRVLALILSKAVLLAADTAITDPTIVRQIRS